MIRSIIIAAALLVVAFASPASAAPGKAWTWDFAAAPHVHVHHHAHHHHHHRPAQHRVNPDEKAPPVNGYVPLLPGRYTFEGGSTT